MVIVPENSILRTTQASIEATQSVSMIKTVCLSPCHGCISSKNTHLFYLIHSQTDVLLVTLLVIYLRTEMLPACLHDNIYV